MNLLNKGGELIMERDMLIKQIMSVHRDTITNGRNGDVINPCHGKDGTPDCKNLSKSSGRLCQDPEGLIYSRDMVLCPRQRGALGIEKINHDINS